jgi:hypothetical protein
MAFILAKTHFYVNSCNRKQDNGMILMIAIENTAMLNLRRYIDIRTFFITIKQIAQHLGISQDRILNWEKWQHVLWVHIEGKGGYFISYRKLEQWITVCRILMQGTKNKSTLDSLWKLIEREYKRYTAEAWVRLSNIRRKREIYLLQVN